MGSKKTIIFRADASSEIGMGHVIRSLALADMLKSEFNCIFATRLFIPSLRSQILDVCDELVDLPIDDAHFDIFVSMLKGDEIIVLDNYFFDTNYQRKIKDLGCKLVCIDDIADRHFVADLVINHSPVILEKDYSKESYTRLLLGFKYILLRKEFLLGQNNAVKNNDSKIAFVCFGGADPANLTCRFVEELLSKSHIKKINVVVGEAFKYFEELSFISLDKRIVIHKNVNSKKLVQVINDSDFGIVPCSGILLECLALALPVLTGYYIDNQKKIAQYFFEKLPDCYLGDLRKINFKNLNLGISNCKPLDIIDSCSNIRLNNEFKNTSDIIEYRKAIYEDVDVIFNWSNDNIVRLQSFNSEPIIYENHIKWFKNKVNDSESFFVICSVNKRPAGLVRFSKDAGSSVIGVLIDEKFRGRGLAPIFLRNSVKFYRESGDDQIILAYIKKDNKASVISFEKAGFKYFDESQVNNEPCYIYNIDVE